MPEKRPRKRRAVAGSHEGTRPPTHGTSSAAERELDSAGSFDGSSQEIVSRQNQVVSPTKFTDTRGDSSAWADNLIRTTCSIV